MGRSGKPCQTLDHPYYICIGIGQRLLDMEHFTAGMAGICIYDSRMDCNVPFACQNTES